MKKETKSKQAGEIKEIFGEAAPGMGAMYLVSNKKLGGDKRKK